MERIERAKVSVVSAFGAAARSRPAALLAGSVGLVVPVVELQTGHTTALGTAFIPTILALPYLAGFGVVTLGAALLPSESSPGV